MDKNLNIPHTPLVTVMMPVFNGEKYIKFAIESILSQTYKDFELLIVNDASTDKTVNIIHTYKDSRIRLIHNSKQLGLSAIRQRGISKSRGRLIAFLDSDDITLSHRLEKQINFLGENAEVAAVGSWVEVIDEKGSKTGRIWRHATSERIIPSILLFRNCFTQSSMMVRKKHLVEFGYRQDYWAAPDYDLWSRMIAKYKMANISEVLTYYRMYKESMSYRQEKEIKNCTQEIMTDNLKRLGLNPTQEEVVIHDSLERHQEEFSVKEIDKVQTWLIKLVLANKKKGVYPEKIFNAAVSDYWFKVCCVSANRGLEIYKKYSSSDMRTNRKKSLILFTLSVFQKSHLIDVSSDTWIKMTH